MTDAVKYLLKDRPKWWLPKLMKWVAILGTALSIIIWVVSMALEALDTYALNGSASGEGSVVMNFSYMADEILWGAIGILFYAAVLWMLSLAVDKIDQLVWLKASDEDREFLLRKKKKNSSTGVELIGGSP